MAFLTCNLLLTVCMIPVPSHARSYSGSGVSTLLTSGKYVKIPVWNIGTKDGLQRILPDLVWLDPVIGKITWVFHICLKGSHVCWQTLSRTYMMRYVNNPSRLLGGAKEECQECLCLVYISILYHPYSGKLMWLSVISKCQWLKMCLHKISYNIPVIK